MSNPMEIRIYNELDIDIVKSSDRMEIGEYEKEPREIISSNCMDLVTCHSFNGMIEGKIFYFVVDVVFCLRFSKSKTGENKAEIGRSVNGERPTYSKSPEYGQDKTEPLLTFSGRKVALTWNLTEGDCKIELRIKDL